MRIILFDSATSGGLTKGAYQRHISNPRLGLAHAACIHRIKLHAWFVAATRGVTSACRR